MCKFSQANYTKDSITKIIKALHVTDEYPYEVLADYAGLSASMMRQIADGNRDFKAHNFEMLKFNLAEKDGNLRALKISIPSSFGLIQTGEVKANGCPDDEVIDGGEALYMFRDGHRATNIDVIDESIKSLEDVLKRAKAERARLEGKNL